MSPNKEPAFLFARARPQDSDAMRQLAGRAYAVYVDRIGTEPAPMTADYDSIAASGGALLVWQGRDLKGMLITRLEERALLVENIAVSPDVQGSGLGSMLLAEAERMAISNGKDQVRLYTNVAMVENLAFYPRRGYHETHRALDNGFHRVYFAKRMASQACDPAS